MSAIPMIPIYRPSEAVITRLQAISKMTQQLDVNPRAIPKETRVEIMLMLAVTFREFKDFAYVGMRFLGFTLTPMQADIAEYMQYGPRKCMVSAQRGEAKSTLAALYAVWRTIHDWTEHTLIISAGETQASEVANLVIRLIMHWHLLCCMRPDAAAGDQTSIEHFDIHYTLKGVNKSPTLACVGVTAALQGKRASLLIPDDIESTKNGLTQTQREQLLTVSKDFAAINTHGKTLYLGTPQTKDSIYKTLPSRGFEVRIWCGRIPSVEQQETYGEQLAPYITQMCNLGAERTGYGLDGTLGEVTDPYRYDEAALVEKEEDFGPEGFQLQYMLDTALSDAQRTKIKLEDFIVFDGDCNMVPNAFSWANTNTAKLNDLPEGYSTSTMLNPAYVAAEMIPFSHKVAVIDPAGCGGDEISFAIGGAASSYIHLFSTGGFQGGTSEANLNSIIDLLVEYGVNDVVVESNMGHGTVSLLLIHQLRARKLTGIGVRDKNNSTQKERRIIDTVSPVTRRHKLIVHRSALSTDTECCMKYPRERRWKYSAFVQMRDITYDRGSLVKDDRADAVAMMVEQLQAHLVKDETKEAIKREAKKQREYMANPMGYSDFKVGSGGGTLGGLSRKGVTRYSTRGSTAHRMCR